MDVLPFLNSFFSPGIPSSEGRRSPPKHSRSQQRWLARPPRWGWSVLGSASLGRIPRREFTAPEMNVEIKRCIHVFLPHFLTRPPKDVTPKPNLRCPMALGRFICTHTKNVGA